MAKINSLIGLAFKSFVGNVRKSLEEEDPSKEYSDSEITGLLGRIFKDHRKSYVVDLGPALTRSFVDGALESGFGLDRSSVETLAFNYAAKIIDYANEMTSLAAAEAYRGLINRKKRPNEAFSFMQRVFGVDRRAVRALLSMFDAKEPENKTLREGNGNKQKRLDSYVAAAIEVRAKKMGEEESFGAKEMSKALVWNLAKRQGLAEGRKKRWMTAEDELVCPVCGPMNMKTVGMDEQFTLPNGSMVWAPPIHPHCRCRIVTVVQGGSVKRPSFFGSRPKEKVSKSDNYFDLRGPDGKFRAGGTKRFGQSNVALVKPVERIIPTSPFRRGISHTDAPTARYNEGGYKDEHSLRAERQRATQAPVRQSSVAVMDIDWDQLEREMAQVPKVETKTKVADPDVKAALEETKTVAKPDVLAIDHAMHKAYSTEGQLVNVVAVPKEKLVTKTVALSSTAIAEATLARTDLSNAQLATVLNTVHLADVATTVAVDVAASVATVAPTETKVESPVITGLLDRPQYGVILGEGQVSGGSIMIPENYSMSSDGHEVVDSLVRHYESFVDEALTLFEKGEFTGYGVESMDTYEREEFMSDYATYMAVQRAMNLGDIDLDDYGRYNKDDIYESFDNMADRAGVNASVDDLFNELGIDDLFKKADDSITVVRMRDNIDEDLDFHPGDSVDVLSFMKDKKMNAHEVAGGYFEIDLLSDEPYDRNQTERLYGDSNDK